jgi:hypothetical protein
MLSLLNLYVDQPSPTLSLFAVCLLVETNTNDRNAEAKPVSKMLATFEAFQTSKALLLPSDSEHDSRWRLAETPLVVYLLKWLERRG